MEAAGTSPSYGHCHCKCWRYYQSNLLFPNEHFVQGGSQVCHQRPITLMRLHLNPQPNTFNAAQAFRHCISKDHETNSATWETETYEDIWTWPFHQQVDEFQAEWERIFFIIRPRPCSMNLVDPPSC